MASAPSSAPHRCPACKAPTTPHCKSPTCPWVTCVERDCAMTMNPARPELAPTRLIETHPPRRGPLG